MKNIYTIVGLGFILFSCDNRKDYFAKFNTTPKIEIKKDNTNNPFTAYVFDSIWVGNPNSYIGNFRIEDNLHDSIILDYENLLGDGVVEFNEDNKSFSVKNFTANKNRYKITTEDKFGAKGSAELQLYKVNNRTPNAKLFVIQTNSNALNEINISAASSNDVDSPFGDYIKEYQYKVGNTYTVNTIYSNINFIAASTGTVWISLKVKDSQGAVSLKDSVLYNIQ